MAGENLENNINSIQEKMEANENEAGNIIEKNPDNITLVVDGNSSFKKAKEELIKPEFDPVTMNIEKTPPITQEAWRRKDNFPETYAYTKPLLTIKDLKSGDSNIPEENKPDIIRAINDLWDFQTLKIIGCTDASQINTPNAIAMNKKQFDDVRAKYITSGGKCPTYDELLKSPEDPQNTILWYSRAMEWILSLNLNSDQIKKVEVGNKLWTREKEWSERWFDVETNYSEEITRTIEWVVYENIYRIFGDLNKKNIGWYNSSDGINRYAIDEIQIATSEGFEKLYQDIFMGTKSFVWENNEELENKIKQQTTDFLEHLIHWCGGEYGNGSWSSNTISDKMYYLIKATDPTTWFLSQEEFSELIENGNLSILENETLASWWTVIDFIKNNNIKSVYKPSGDMYFYTTPDQGSGNRSERKIENKDDFLKLALYFDLKNSQK